MIVRVNNRSVRAVWFRSHFLILYTLRCADPKDTVLTSSICLSLTILCTAWLIDRDGG